MENSKWKTDRWFVSHLNYEPEVTKNLHFPPQIEIHDTTLRDGEQETGVEFRWYEKVEIAERLAEAGVHRIEAGMPAVSPDDEKAVREIVKRNLGPKIMAFCRCIVDDVKLAADCGVDGIVVEIPSSGHIIEKAYQWPLQKAIDLSVQATSVAKELGLYTTFFTIDASRADLGWLKQIIANVAEHGHMDALTLVDTMGVCSHHAINYFVRSMKEAFGQFPLEAHFHNDLGLAVANTLEALSLGVQVAHTTVAGLGERCGGAALEELAVALLVLYGIDIGIDTTRLYSLAHRVAELSGHRLPQNKALVGTEMYKLESGIPSVWFRRCTGDLSTEVFPLRHDLVGQPAPRIVLGKASGEDSVRAWLEALGVEASPEQVTAMLRRVKQRSLELKGLLSKEDFQVIVDETLKS